MGFAFKMKLRLSKHICIGVFIVPCLILFSLKANSALTSTTVTITGNVVPRTCVFEEQIQQVILPDILVKDLAQQATAGHTTFSVNIHSCHSSVTALNLSISGESEPGTLDMLHKNTGSSENVALRLAVVDDDDIVLPSGFSRKIQIVNGGGGIQLVAAYSGVNFPVKAGSFSATVTLSFEYL